MELPEPLTPADCDLRGLPFMPLDVVRLLDSDFFALSTPAEFKAGVSLWCKSWLQVPAASLPDDDRILAHLSGAGTAWRKMKDGAMRGWRLCSDGRWYHPTVAEKANEAWKHRLSQRAKIAKRWNRGTDEDGGGGNTVEHTTVSTPVIQGTGTGRVKREEEPDGPSSQSPKPPSGEFDEFWKAYPRRVGKEAARKAWTACRKRGVEPWHMIEGAQWLAEHPPDDPQFIPHPATWLNQGRYDDERTLDAQRSVARNSGANGQAGPYRRSVGRELLADAQRQWLAEQGGNGLA